MWDVWIPDLSSGKWTVSERDFDMFNLLKKEELLLEDGIVSASSLPFDERQSQVAYETATFGTG